MEKKNNPKFTGNLTKVKPGTWFKAEIDLIDVIGQVQIDHTGIYLCQNEKNGNHCDDRLGFRYSWAVNENISNLYNDDVKNFILLKSKPKNYIFKEIKLPIFIDGNEVKFNKGYIEVGCTIISNKIVKAIVKKLKS